MPLGTTLTHWCCVHLATTYCFTKKGSRTIVQKMHGKYNQIPPFRIRCVTSVPLGKGTKFTLHHGKMSTTKRRAIQILHISTFQFAFKCGYRPNDFISKYTDINSLHVTQIDLHHNDTLCSTEFARFRCKKGSFRVNSVIILVVLSTHAELASATARGRSYWETGELHGRWRLSSNGTINVTCI